MKEGDFLEAIHSSPEDNNLRLVFADWLEENGDAGRAEFIRLQIALDPLPWWDVRHFCANLRLQHIIASHSERWDNDLPLWARRVCDEARYQSYSRGMPSIIHCDVADWLTHGRELLARIPIGMVKFSWYKLQNRLCDWLASPLTSRVKHFDLSGQYFTDDDIRTISSGPALAHVETLILSDNMFGDGGAVALAESDYLENLQELDLGTTNVGPAGFRAITQSRSLPKLRRLTIGHNHSTVGDAEMRELDGSPHQYEKLIAYGTLITDKGVEFLCNAKCVSGLKHLDLGGNALTGTAAEALGNSAKLANLEILQLLNSRIGDPGATAISKSPFLGQLRYLNLLRCGIGPKGGSALGHTRTLGNLIDLDLSFNACGDEPLIAMAETNVFQNLLDLQLKATSITSSGISALAKSPGINRLIRLDLASNQIDDRGAMAIARAANFEDLRLLILYGNRISNRGAKALAASRLRQMRILQLGDNQIEDAGALAFLHSLPGDCNLVLHGNPISDAAWKKLEKVKGDFFLLHYSDDLLSIPQRTPNSYNRRRGKRASK